jgi:hypothetical protein
MADMTNYERIKNMSVEELADFLYNSVNEDECGEKFIKDELMFSQNNIVNWLNSEAENG